jgi:starch synthase
MVASEVAPWAKTGGLADVTGALPAALTALGHSVTVVLPKYRKVSLPSASQLRRTVALGQLGFEVTYHVADLAAKHRIVLVDVPQFFDREGFYGASGQDYDDNADRFAVLTAAALEYGEYEHPEPIDVVHAHDWQAGLAPTLLRVAAERYPRLSRAGLVFTIHNLAYQGLFPRDVVPRLSLPWTTFTMDTGEFYNQFSYLKAGIAYSDYVTTVSPSYARETLTPEFGYGLEGLLTTRQDRYVGILNGIDTSAWDPAADPLLPAHFDADHLEGKSLCKRALLERFGFAQGDDRMARPVIGMVSRLVAQKGLDLIQQGREPLIDCDATWVFLGTGDRQYEEFLRAWAARHPARVGVHIGFSESLAHLVEAGSDIFMMPSLFEPCGLNQMYSLRYGTVPIVRAVGGLEDTIQPYTARAIGANGFKFREATAEALVRTTRQAVRLYQNKQAWLSLVRNGMAADHSWATSAREYVKVYRRARAAAEARPAR